MNQYFSTSFLLFAFPALVLADEMPAPTEFPVGSSVTFWPSFRGGANNEISEREMPREWSDEKNIAWKIELPGYGQSTPVFGNGAIFVTSTIATEEAGPVKAGEKGDEGEKGISQNDQRGDEGAKASGNGPQRGKGGKGSKGKGGKSMAGFMAAADGPMKTGVAVSCIDPESGKIVWTTEVPCSDPLPINKYRSSAASSPCLDDSAVYAWFESGDLVALNHDGEKLWHRNIGKEHGLPKGNHGLGGSLVQDRESLYVLVDHDGPSYLLCVGKEDGEVRWKVEREKRVSWSTPVVTNDAVIICSNGIVEERDKRTGEQLWVVEGLEGNTVASPLVFRDFVLAPSSEQEQTQLLRRGETEDDRVVWKASGKNTSSFSSPVFARGQVVLVSKAGIASGLDWKTGEEKWVFRLPAGCWATPAVVGDKIFFFTNAGLTVVAELTSEGLREIGRNELTIGSTKVYAVIPVGGKWLFRAGKEMLLVAGGLKVSG